MQPLINDHNRCMHLRFLVNLINLGKQTNLEPAIKGESNEAWNGRTQHYASFAIKAIHQMVEEKLITTEDERKALDKIFN